MLKMSSEYVSEHNFIFLLFSVVAYFKNKLQVFYVLIYYLGESFRILLEKYFISLNILFLL